ncbi:MAG: hypothetical protein CL608_02605 [Anaerolineaceae bacterium]|nr:hypothetical protein [Anaerolineaceae bacterium]
MNGVAGLFILIFDLAVLVVILICCLGLLPYLKLLIWREIRVPFIEMTFEHVSKMNILSLAIIYFRFGEIIVYGSFFPAVRESVSLSAPVLFIKIIAVIISMLLIIIVESFAYSFLLYRLKLYASFPTILWLVFVVNIPTIIVVFLRIFDISLSLYGNGRSNLFKQIVNSW